MPKMPKSVRHGFSLGRFAEIACSVRVRRAEARNNEEYVFPSHEKFCAWLANQKDIIWLDYWAKKEA